MRWETGGVAISLHRGSEEEAILAPVREGETRRSMKYLETKCVLGFERAT